MATLKPRLARIWDAVELAALQAGEGCLSVPHLIPGMGGWYADADELRAWRVSRSGTAPSVEGAGSAEAGQP